MFQADVEAYAPQFRSAVKEINNESPYYRQDDIELNKTADIGPWIPSDEVLKHVPDAADIPIVLIDEFTDFTRLLNELMNAEKVGLVLMGDKYGSRKRAAIILLTTSTRYYALDPGFDAGIDFLRRCLSEPNLIFWTTGGLNDACCLLEHHNISLLGSNAKDCLGLHLHLMKLLASMPDNITSRDTPTIYPFEAIKHAKRVHRLDRFEKLVYLWLGVDDRNIDCDPSQFKHLTRRPLDFTAENLIRKKCALVLSLAESLMHNCSIEYEIMNKNVLSSLIHTTGGDTAVKVMKKNLRDCEKERRPSSIYFTHLEQTF